MITLGLFLRFKFHQSITDKLQQLTPTLTEFQAFQVPMFEIIFPIETNN